MAQPNTARADRLHALFIRNARRFADAAFAARRANDQLEAITPSHSSWAALRGVQMRSTAQMAHLNARSIKLARAEIAAAIGVRNA